ncbi:hypothetical protein K788_0000061 [Paraburkholderia caribensis MBA4]|uniref:Uncharacterized protein n=1 Tax=Paraburkholderia caribensis MBA4 TaxID=1323664 RepID=A0A0P0RJT0_9BURK|nr:hypothetical protein [Paraburkholderia caribensis]ALL68938.1 hypothetical protein K788_0000061 [Paraburkholderia caribensis MBA4]
MKVHARLAVLWRHLRQPMGDIDTTAGSNGKLPMPPSGAQTQARHDAIGAGLTSDAVQELLRRAAARINTQASQPGEGAKPVSSAAERQLIELGKSSVQFGARLLVMREMLKALVTLLSEDNRLRAEVLLRTGVEEVMAAADDKPLPAIFHDALLGEVQTYLRILQSRS